MPDILFAAQARAFAQNQPVLDDKPDVACGFGCAATSPWSHWACAVRVGQADLAAIGDRATESTQRIDGVARLLHRSRLPGDHPLIHSNRLEGDADRVSAWCFWPTLGLKISPPIRIDLAIRIDYQALSVAQYVGSLCRCNLVCSCNGNANDV